MKLVHQVALELSNPANRDELHRTSVEAMRHRLGFDRSAHLLLDMTTVASAVFMVLMSTVIRWMNSTPSMICTN